MTAQRGGELLLVAGLALLLGCSGPAATLQPGLPPAEQAAGAQDALVGRPAPDFTLLNQDKQPVTLSRQHGRWVVLYFYPNNDTPGCTCEASEFTGLLQQFRGMNAEIFGISADTPDNHRMLSKKYDLQLIALSDPDQAVMRQYGAWAGGAPGHQQPVIRSTVIIDPQGLVRHCWREVVATGHVARVRETLAALQSAG